MDSDYRYSIAISYAEIYNDKIYDLLADNNPGNRRKDLLKTNAGQNAILVQRKALTLRTGSDGNKYVDGLKELRVQSAAEGKRLLSLGQLNRRVFGTLANQASSRSHAIVTIKVSRIPLDARVS